MDRLPHSGITNSDRLPRFGIIMGSVATFWHNHWIGYHILGIFKRLLIDLAKKIDDRSNSRVSQLFRDAMGSLSFMSTISGLRLCSSKQIDVVIGEGTSQSPPRRAEQSEAQDESLSQTSPTPPSPRDLRREAAPREPLLMLQRKI
uniref:Uncharacterized protein n=1 Tax=Solanum tuberosum TaxID=4113 RepID=M1DLA5_SOLTU